MISILSYVIVLLGFGVPIWWHTTRVYRAPLPLEEMLDLRTSDFNALPVHIYATNNERLKSLSHEIQTILGSTVFVSTYKNKLSVPASESEEDIENFVKSNEIPSGNLLFIEWPNCSKEIIATTQRILFFSSDTSGYKLAMLLQKWPGVELKTALADPNLNRIDEEILRPFPAEPKFDVLVTIVVPDPKSVKINWDFLEAIDQYLKPFLNALTPVANFTIKSQWLYFVDLGVKPRQVGNHWALAEQLLPHIITPLEKKLSSHVSKNPCINFVIYVPPCSMAPIHIYTKKGIRTSGPVDAFVSPRWGGLQISNPNCTSSNYTPDSHQIMSVIITQLSELLGLPFLSVPTLTTIPQTGSHPSIIHIDYLVRLHTFEYLTKSKETLRSLAQLLSEISNIVINDDVAASVHDAMDNIKMAEEFLMAGKNEEAFKCSKKAAGSSESAFTDPSLLALLYFPDDQKYAVYIPLFLPIMIPVIMSMKQLLQYFQKQKIVPEKK